MESIFQVLLVIAVIVYAIVRQSNESANKRKKQAEANTPRPYQPTTAKHTGRVSPEPFLSYDYEEDYHLSPTDRRLAQSSIHTQTLNEKENGAALSPTTEPSDTEQEFDIHSTENVRRGIIWSEILNRKY